jgi:hypothetical protein
MGKIELELEYVSSWKEFCNYCNNEFTYYISGCKDINKAKKDLEATRKGGKMLYYSTGT